MAVGRTSCQPSRSPSVPRSWRRPRPERLSPSPRGGPEASICCTSRHSTIQATIATMPSMIAMTPISARPVLDVIQSNADATSTNAIGSRPSIRQHADGLAAAVKIGGDVSRPRSCGPDREAAYNARGASRGGPFPFASTAAATSSWLALIARSRSPSTSATRDGARPGLPPRLARRASQSRRRLR